MHSSAAAQYPHGAYYQNKASSGSFAGGGHNQSNWEASSLASEDLSVSLHDGVSRYPGSFSKTYTATVTDGLDGAILDSHHFGASSETAHTSLYVFAPCIKPALSLY